MKTQSCCFHHVPSNLVTFSPTEAGRIVALRRLPHKIQVGYKVTGDDLIILLYSTIPPIGIQRLCLRGLCTGRSRVAAIIFLLSLQALFSRVPGPSRRLIFLFPKCWLLLALTTRKPVCNALLSFMWVLAKY